VSTHDLLQANIRVKTIGVLEVIQESANHFVKKSLTCIKKQGGESLQTYSDLAFIFLENTRHQEYKPKGLYVSILEKCMKSLSE
jgi:hypothetical protein